MLRTPSALAPLLLTLAAFPCPAYGVRSREAEGVALQEAQALPVRPAARADVTPLRPEAAIAPPRVAPGRADLQLNALDRNKAFGDFGMSDRDRRKARKSNPLNKQGGRPTLGNYLPKWLAPRDYQQERDRVEREMWEQEKWEREKQARASIRIKARTPTMGERLDSALDALSQVKFEFAPRTESTRSLTPVEKSIFQLSTFDPQELVSSITGPEIIPVSGMDDLTERFEWPKEIGRGSESVIYRTRLRDDPDTVVAIKQSSPQDGKSFRKAIREIEIMSAFNGKPGFVTIYAASETKNLKRGDDIYIAMELASCNLADVMTMEYGELAPITRLVLFGQILRAVADMHRFDVTHRDLKPENVLLLGNRDNLKACEAVLCDFGGACSVADGTWPADPNDMYGTEEYLAPEAWRPGHFGMERDIWALGIMLYQLIFRGRLPKAIAAAANPRARALGEDVGRVILDGWTVEKDKAYLELRQVDPQLASFLRRLLTREPWSRPTADQAWSMLKQMLVERGEALGDKSAVRLGLEEDRAWTDLPGDFQVLNKKTKDPLQSIQVLARQLMDDLDAGPN